MKIYFHKLLEQLNVFSVRNFYKSLFIPRKMKFTIAFTKNDRQRISVDVKPCSSSRGQPTNTGAAKSSVRGPVCRGKKKKEVIASLPRSRGQFHRCTDTFLHKAWQAWNLGRVAIRMVIAGQQRIINTALRVIWANLSARAMLLETPLRRSSLIFT